MIKAYVVARAGHTIIAPYRCDSYGAKALKQTGDLGQIALTVLMKLMDRDFI